MAKTRMTTTITAKLNHTACGMVKPPNGASGNAPTRGWQIGQEAEKDNSGDVFRPERTDGSLFLATEGGYISQIPSLLKNMVA